MRWLATGLLACVAYAVVVPREAGALEVRLRSEACGSTARLWHHLQRRLTRRPALGWRATVDIVQRGRLLETAIELEDPRGRVSRRQLQGEHCASLLEAAALVIALTLEPPPVVRAARPPELRLGDARPHSGRRPWNLGVTGFGGLRSDLGSASAWQAAAGLALTHESVSPWLLSLEYLRARGGVSERGRRASLTLDAAALRVLPYWPRLSEGLTLAPALGLEVGRLEAVGEFEGGQRAAGAWLAALGEAGVEFHGRHLGLGLAPTLQVLLKRDRFAAFDKALHRSPRFGLGGRIRLSFWYAGRGDRPAE